MKARLKVYLSFSMSLSPKPISLRVISKNMIVKKFFKGDPLRFFVIKFFTSDLANFRYIGVFWGAEHEKDISFPIRAHLNALLPICSQGPKN